MVVFCQFLKRNLCWCISTQSNNHVKLKLYENKMCSIVCKRMTVGWNHKYNNVFSIFYFRMRLSSTKIGRRQLELCLASDQYSLKINYEIRVSLSCSAFLLFLSISFWKGKNVFSYKVYNICLAGMSEQFSNSEVYILPCRISVKQVKHSDKDINSIYVV